jgi:hypothetical protein
MLLLYSRKIVSFSNKPLTLKQRTRSPSTMDLHCEDSKGMERWRIHFSTFTHSSSSAPKPSNLTRTSWNSSTEILSYKKDETELEYANNKGHRNNKGSIQENYIREEASQKVKAVTLIMK